MKKVICPFCGYKMPIFFEKHSLCVGITVKCKGRRCGKIFPLCIGMDSPALTAKGILSNQFEIYNSKIR